MGRIVRERMPIKKVVEALQLDATHEPQFEPSLEGELKSLEVHNCARYRVATSAVESWIAAGRPA